MSATPRCLQKAQSPLSVTRMDFLFWLLVNVINHNHCMCAHTCASVYLCVHMCWCSMCAQVCMKVWKRVVGHLQQSCRYPPHRGLLESMLQPQGTGQKGDSFLQAGNPLGELTTDALHSCLCAHPIRSQPLAMPIKCERVSPAESHKLKVQETSNDVQKKLSRVRGFFFSIPSFLNSAFLMGVIDELGKLAGTWGLRGQVGANGQKGHFHQQL